MNYSSLSPVWIISTLSAEESNKFVEKMNQQMLAFAQNEFGAEFAAETHRWWSVCNIQSPDELKINNSGYPADIPALSLPPATFQDNHLRVVLYGSPDDFDQRAFGLVEALKKKKKESQFMMGSGAEVRYYGVCTLQQRADIAANLKEKISNHKQFDVFYFQGDCNRTTQNINGYPALENEEVQDLSVQIVYHLALAKKLLLQPNQKKLQVVGAFSLNFEPEIERRRMANTLTKAIRKKFAEDEESEYWHKKSTVGVSDNFKSELGWRSIYHNLKSGYADWETEGLSPISPESPWRLFSKLLIPKYFKKYIRRLVKQVRENTDAFSFVTRDRYQNHLDNQYQKITDDDAQRKRVEDEIFSVWDPEKRENGAVGMQQIKSVLGAVKDFFTEQQQATQNLLDQKPADSTPTAFPKLEDFPLSNFGTYRENYEKFMRREGPADCVPGTEKFGADLLKKLTRILKFHPIPLSLVVRSMLAGILLPMVIWTILCAIPDFLFNTASLETYPGMVFLFIGCFIFCLLLGLVQYAISILDHIKRKIREYIGWYLYRTQTMAYRMTLEKEMTYYQKALSLCEAITQNINSFIENQVDIKEKVEYRFKVNKFQGCVMEESFEGHKILKDNTIKPVVTVSLYNSGSGHEDQQRKVEAVEEIYYGVFRKVFVLENGNGPLKTLLRVLLFKKDDQKQAPTVQSFYDKLVESVYENIGFVIGSKEVGSLYDILFHDPSNTNNNSRNNNLCEVKIADYINYRSYPSCDIETYGSSFRYVSYCVPPFSGDESGHVELWNRMFGLTPGRTYCTQLGDNEVSILQGYAVENLTDIKNL
ncbi:MAG: hypothetical protein ACTTKO_09965 [Candidatus Limimorpha sp.]